MKEKNHLSIAFLALAFVFKLQTVFIMPVYFILFIKKQIKLKHLPTFFITYFITCIPALIMKKPFADIIGIYLSQTSEYPMMSLNAPTLWQMLDIIEQDGFLEKVGIILAGCVVFAFSGMYFFRKNKTDNKAILHLAAIFAIGIPFFLPHMHDRYFFMADIISVIYIFAFGLKRVYVPVLVQCASLICYSHFLEINLLGNFGNFDDRRLSGAMMLAAFLIILVYWCIDFRRENNKKTEEKLIV